MWANTQNRYTMYNASQLLNNVFKLISIKWTCIFHTIYICILLIHILTIKTCVHACISRTFLVNIIACSRPAILNLRPSNDSYVALTHRIDKKIYISKLILGTINIKYNKTIKVCRMHLRWDWLCFWYLLYL